MALLSVPLMVLGDQSLYVSAGGKLVVFKQTGTEFTRAQTIDLNGSAGPSGISPSGKHLYVNTMLPEKTPAIATFSIESEGTLEHVHTAASEWNCGYLRPDSTGKYFAGNNYRNGIVGLWKLAEDGVYRGAKPLNYKLEKHAHSAVFSPDNRFLFVPATGPNKIFQLIFNSETGAISSNTPAFAPGTTNPELAQQPRHLVFHPSLDFAYTTQEKLHPGAGVWKYDKENGLLENIQSIRSLEVVQEKTSTADLHLSKDGRFLYVSNRNKAGDLNSISLFSIDQTTGKLSFEKRFPCEKVPRSFAIGVEGEYLFVSSNVDPKLGVYSIDRKNGHLSKISSHDLPGRSKWVSVLKIPK